MADLYQWYRITHLSVQVLASGTEDVSGELNGTGYVQYTPGTGHTNPVDYNDLEGPHIVAFPVDIATVGYHPPALSVPRSALVSQVQWFATDDASIDDLNCPGTLFFLLSQTPASTVTVPVLIKYSVEFQGPLDPDVTARNFLERRLKEYPEVLAYIEEKERKETSSLPSSALFTPKK